MRGPTDVGFIVKISDSRVKAGTRTFKVAVNGAEKKAIMQGFGEVDLKEGAITFSIEGGHSDIESQEAAWEQFRVVLDEPMMDIVAVSPNGKTFDFFVSDASGLLDIETHGLIGTFLCQFV